MDETGYTQFDLRWIHGLPPENALISELNYWRSRCFDEGLIGCEPNGIGFGNVSVRVRGSTSFVISGTQTGSDRKLVARQYTTVADWCIQENRVMAIGPIAASSESLSHAAVYSVGGRIGAVLHVHSHTLWQELLDRVPTTARKAEAGTPEIAREIQRLVPEALGAGRIIVMGGHRDGLIAFGAGPASAVETLFAHVRGLN